MHPKIFFYTIHTCNSSLKCSFNFIQFSLFLVLYVIINLEAEKKFLYNTYM